MRRASAIVQILVTREEDDATLMIKDAEACLDAKLHCSCSLQQEHRLLVEFSGHWVQLIPPSRDNLLLPQHLKNLCSMDFCMMQSIHLMAFRSELDLPLTFTLL